MGGGLVVGLEGPGGDWGCVVCLGYLARSRMGEVQGG